MALSLPCTLKMLKSLPAMLSSCDGKRPPLSLYSSSIKVASCRARFWPSTEPPLKVSSETSSLMSTVQPVMSLILWSSIREKTHLKLWGFPELLPAAEEAASLGLVCASSAVASLSGGDGFASLASFSGLKGVFSSSSSPAFSCSDAFDSSAASFCGSGRTELLSTSMTLSSTSKRTLTVLPFLSNTFALYHSSSMRASTMSVGSPLAAPSTASSADSCTDASAADRRPKSAQYGSS
mmetsp:Transcript_75930/g.180518  ORF Transcript_75930/g.180518 Transcript_75930/m.180518 type:complete len:237 (+) Transcript_75930:3146-3856(+)